MPALNSRANVDPHIFFGYETAFRILRRVPPAALLPARGKACALPDRAPSAGEIEAAVGRLETAYPGLVVEGPWHVLVGGAVQRRASQACRWHACTASLSGMSFYQLEGGIFVSAPTLAFVHEATREASAVALLELGYELCGTYQTRRTGPSSAYDVVPLASVRELGDYVARNPSVYGARKVARIVRYLADGSASARETKQALVLGLPHRHGGYGLGIPHMNYEVKASGPARAISGKGFFRADLCWPEKKLDVEYQSRERHEGELVRITDSRRTNALMSMGWTVVGVTNDELDSFVATETIAHTLRRYLGKHSQIRVSNYHARKLKLRRQLGLPMGYE
ncbi:endonuclease domain-containing protein [Gordonibacter massiliensis (ex Traore et al. 2017)]|uniref:endonuclease domain-containing protein n=1 Tax=Gordonibacter massiliensis (ex Traore et al. 2017) TaxID=1841863 RepID=UPI001C8C21DE|nr:endonuclease domain-containing protein [Gordonibacter massiliensis (ex Traore et al. 2017)]MBX9035297.1 DUF559 domain-containing protein [Gordonibacter massiliensis (ex Traore et al. 2017)]